MMQFDDALVEIGQKSKDIVVDIYTESYEAG